MKNLIYLDYNDTTPIDPEVFESMVPYLTEHFGNPSSNHRYGKITKEAIEHAREQLANLINCSPSEIVFTSGGTESNNYAIMGIASKMKSQGNHIITSQIEHPAVSEVCAHLEKKGFEITYLPVDEYGLVSIGDIEKSIRKSTILITIMHANNEIGTIQPIAEIGELAKKNKIHFHTDAAQSVGKLEIDVKKMNVDLLSIAGHKFYAPKGIGALYVKKSIILTKMMHGANHELNRRPGTENVSGIIGLGKAAEIAKRDFKKNYDLLYTLRETLFNKLKEKNLDMRLNGHQTKRLPNTLSVSFPNKESSLILSKLEEIAASAGSACHANDIKISGVLKAINLPIHYATGTIRFSIGKFLSLNEIEKASGLINAVIQQLNGKS